MKRGFLISLSVLLGLIFVFSAYVKLYPVEIFELTYIDIGLANWTIAPYLARITIAVEFFIGFMLIMNLYLKQFTLKFSFIVLLIFTIYLTVLILFEGNDGNCKCFGNFISVTPSESIIKNVILIGLTLLLLKYHTCIEYKNSKLITGIIIICSLVLPFILNPIDINSFEKKTNENELNYKLGIDILYNNPKVIAPKEDMRIGKYIIAFMSLTCEHCRIGAYKMHIIKKKNPEIPFFLVLNGDVENLKPFFDDTKATNIPYTILLGKDFIQMAGLKLPAILWIDNGIVVKKSKYIYLEQKNIEDWMNYNSIE